MDIQENKREIVLVDNSVRAAVFIGMGLVSIAIGFILTPSLSGIWEGFVLQQTASNLLDINTFALVGEGNIGVPFINAGLLLIIVMISYRLAGTNIRGVYIAAACMVYGFGFAGKVLWNVWPLFFGVIIHALIKGKKPLSNVLGLAWFSTGLSPLVSLFTLYTYTGDSNHVIIKESGTMSLTGLIIGTLVGLGAGFLIAVFEEFLPEKHTGLTLYNVGFATGLTGFIIFAVMKAIGIAHIGPGPWHDSPDIANGKLIIGAAVCLVYLFLMGLIIMRKEGGDIRDIVPKKYMGSGLELFGLGAVLINMAVCGFVCLIYWGLTVTANMHGVFFAALFTVVGFAANGITVRTMVPIMAGVYVTSFVLGGISGIFSGMEFEQPFIHSAFAYVGSKSMLIAAVFGCGMAPLVYKDGAKIGFLAGMIHSLIVPNTGGLHGWMNLYNNGFCIGLVVTFFVPMILGIRAAFKKTEEQLPQGK